MADYRGEWFSLEAALDSAFLTTPLPRLHEHVMIDPHAPSAVRVLGKSMYVLAAGWVASIAWLWIATVQQQLYRHGAPPPYYALDTVVAGLIPAALMAYVGIRMDRWTGPAPTTLLQRREWWHAFWWSLVPNALLLITVWVMIQEGR